MSKACSASTAMSGSTPVPSQFVPDTGLAGFPHGMSAMRWLPTRWPSAGCAPSQVVLLWHPRVADYAPWFPIAFDQGTDVQPEVSARLAVRLVTLQDARLSRRLLNLNDIASIDDIGIDADTIAADDLYTLRLRRPAASEPDSKA